MDKTRQKNISFMAASGRERHKSYFDIALIYLTAFILFASVWGCLMSMSSIKEYVIGISAGAVVFVIAAFTAKNRYAQRIFFSVLFLAVLVFIIAQWQLISNGLKIVANQMFLRSESKEAYVYEMFAIGVEQAQYEFSVRLALLALATVLSGIFALVFEKYNRVLGLSVFFSLAVAVSYFGVSPDIFYSAVLVFALALNFALCPKLLSIDSGKTVFLRGTAVLLALVVLAGGVIWALRPGENPQISELDTYLRDELAIRPQYFLNHMQNELQTDIPKDEATPDAAVQKPTGRSGSFDISKLADIELTPTMKLVLLLAMLLLILFLPAVFMDRHKKRIQKNREGLDDSSNSRAIFAMFQYTMRWLLAFGMEPLNDGFRAYENQLKSCMSNEIAREFPAIVKMWHEAAYSNNQMTAMQREIMGNFMSRIISSINENGKWKVRMKIKYIYAL